MSKRARVLSVIAAIVLLPVLAAAVAVAVIDPNDYKPQIEADVLRATGRALSLGGKLRISVSLWPTIEVSDVKLANLPGGTRADMARAERIEAQLSVLPLLWRRVDVRRLTLIGPNILFEKVGGRANWVFTPEAGRAGGAAPSGPSGGRTTLRFRDVRVQNGMVTWRLAQGTRVLGMRSLAVQHLADRDPITLSGVLIHADQPIDVTASARPVAADAGPWRTSFTLAADGARLAAEGTAMLSGGYDMQLDGQAAALEALQPLLPQLRLPALHQLHVVTHLQSDATTGAWPGVGATRVEVGASDLGGVVPGLTLAAFEASAPAAGGMATVSGNGSLGGQALRLAGQVGVPAQARTATSLPVDLALLAQGGSGTPGRLAFKGALAVDGSGLGALDGAMTLTLPELAAFRPLAPRLPALTDVSLAGGVTLPADRRTMSLHKATLSTGQGDLAGEVTIGLASPALTGSLRAARLDLDAVMRAFGSARQVALVAPAAPGAAAVVPTPAAAPAASGTMIPNAPLPWAALRGPALDVTADVTALQLWQQSWHDVSLAAQLKDGWLRIGRFGLSFPDGPLSGSLAADARTDQVPVDLALHAPAVPLALVGWLARLPSTMTSGMTGALRLDAQLHGTGRSAHELAASLDGTIRATMVGGSLSNAALVAIAAQPLQALNITVPAEGQTAIRCLALIGGFAKGIGTLPTIALDTSHLQLDGSGRVDLGAETLALKLHPLVRLSGASVSVPVLVDGPFRSVHGRLDVGGIAKAGLMIDALLGGDRPDTCTQAGLSADAPAQK